MRVDKLVLKNFRNYEEETLEFTEGTNIIYGKNGMGKTNALEAIYYFSQGRGFRGGVRDAVRSGCDGAVIRLFFNSCGREQEGAVYFDGKRKKILLNDIELKKTSQLVGRFGCVLFTPDEMNLVKGAPEVRRRFLDSAIIPLKPAFLPLLLRYDLILKQKISLLRAEKYSMLPVFNQQLAEAGSRIILLRRSYVEKIRGFAAEAQADISSGAERLEISYSSGVRGEGGLEAIREAFLKKLAEMEESEKENKICFVGPHRDDLMFKINGKSARSFASQGQQRSVVVCMKCAQMELLREETDEYPVLLLDDIMSELDRGRREFLTERIKGKQVIITCTETDGAGAENIIRIENGAVAERRVITPEKRGE